jgi:hypothetical protein
VHEDDLGVQYTSLLMSRSLAWPAAARRNGCFTKSQSRPAKESEPGKSKCLAPCKQSESELSRGFASRFLATEFSASAMCFAHLQQGMGASLRRLFRFASQEVKADALTDGSQEGSYGRGSGSKPGTGPTSNSPVVSTPWAPPHGGTPVKKQEYYNSHDPQSVLDLDDRSSLATDRSSALTADRSSAATIDRSSAGSSSRGSGSSSRLVAMLRALIRSPGNPELDTNSTLHGPISMIPEAAEEAATSPTSPKSTGSRAVHQCGTHEVHQRVGSPSALANPHPQHQHGTPTRSVVSHSPPTPGRGAPHPPASSTQHPAVNIAPQGLAGTPGQQLRTGTEGLLIMCEVLPPGMARTRWRVEDFVVISKCHAGRDLKVILAHVKHCNPDIFSSPIHSSYGAHPHIPTPHAWMQHLICPLLV